MDMEQLSKSQIVLLTLLVSFVTSIATGIVTVSLMDQAPPAFSQTVNRIIERTVERVVPSGQAAASVVTKEKTIVVKESDLISQAVRRVEPSIVRLYSTTAEITTFLGLGIIADSSGTIVSDNGVLEAGMSAVVELFDKTRVRALVSSRDAASGLIYFSTATSSVDGKPVSWKPLPISGSRPMLGETVVTLAGKTVDRIAAGLVTTLSATPDAVAQTIETDIGPEAILLGSPLINIDGSLLGISTSISRAVSPSGFISTSVLIKPVDKKTQ